MRSDWRLGNPERSLAAALALAACKEPAPAVQPPSQAKDFQTFPCTERDRIRPARAVDYIDVRSVHNSFSHSYLSQGLPCGGAREGACVARLHELEQGAGQRDCLDRHCVGNSYVLTTQGERVDKVDGRAAMLALFGTVDTPSEAWILAMNDGHVGSLLCDNNDEASQKANVLMFGPAATGKELLPAFRAQGTGFELRARWYSKRCDPIEITEDIFEVSSAGVISKVSSTLFWSIDACVSD